MSDTPITTVPLSQFPPCCGTCRHGGRLPDRTGYSHLVFGCWVDSHRSPRAVTCFNVCEHHEPMETSDGDE